MQNYSSNPTDPFLTLGLQNCAVDPNKDFSATIVACSLVVHNFDMTQNKLLGTLPLAAGALYKIQFTDLSYSPCGDRGTPIQELQVVGAQFEPAGTMASAQTVPPHDFTYDIPTQTPGKCNPTIRTRLLVQLTLAGLLTDCSCCLKGAGSERLC